MSIPYNSITHHSEQSAPSDSNSGTQPNSLDQDPDFASEGSERNSQAFSINESKEGDSSDNSWDTNTEEVGRPVTEDEDEYAPLPLDSQQSVYHEETLNIAQKQALTTLAGTHVMYHSRQHRFNSLLHMSLFELSRCVESPGSWIISSKEQSGKTVLMAAMALVSRQLRKPCVIIVNDKKANVGKVCHDLKGMLGSFDIEVPWMGQASSWDAMKQSERLRQCFVTGGVVPVLHCFHCELQRLNTYVQEQGVSGLTVIVDECDSIWSTKVEAEQPAAGAFIRRELELYQLLQGITSPQPLSQGSAVRSFIQVSATHLATMHWHSMWQVPVRHITVDAHALHAHGYTLETDLQLVSTIPAPCKANEYAMRLPEVGQELQEFANDIRKGKLMFFCTCPYVHASNMVTTFDIAKQIVNDHVRDAVCIVVYGGGVHAIYNAQQPGEQSFTTGMGRIMYETSERGIQIFGKKSLRASTENQEPKVVRQANNAIQIIDDEMGLQRPVIVLGYNCVGRCVSIRSRNRVINYMIAAYSNGKTSADLKQMMMRGAGFTRQEREAQGFQHIRLTSTAEDWEVLQKLYDLQLKALKTSATGNIYDLDKWYHGDYNYEEFRPLFEVKRPHIRRRLGHLEFQYGQSTPKCKKRKFKPINLTSSRTRFMQTVFAAYAANGEQPVHEKEFIEFMQAHPEYLPHPSYSKHHNEERSVCTKRCRWIRTDNRGFMHVTDIGLEYRARLQSAMKANIVGPSTSKTIH